jgi:hypothetical protein
MYKDQPIWPISIVIGTLALCSLTATTLPAKAQQRHAVEGEKLVVYVDEESAVDLSKEPAHNYIFEFTEILAINPNIDTIILTGEGGYEEIANEYIKVISEHELNTVARGECLSSCAHIFLAGTKREFERDAVIGFHRSWWGEHELERYFNNNGGTDKFENQFQFAQHIFEEGQAYTIERMQYMLDASLPFEFVAQVFTTSSYEFTMLTAEEFENLIANN